MRKDINREEFIETCKSSLSMAQASVKLGLHFNTFKKYALLFGCYKTNSSGKGMTKKGKPKISLDDITSGNYPQFQTYKLKNRLIKANILKNVCSECGISEWMNKPLNMELDHIDGNRTNHKLENLRMLCPNCHAQTDTYRSKNRKVECL
jgi:heterodisulfide reductase subunit B